MVLLRLRRGQVWLPRLRLRSCSMREERRYLLRVWWMWEDGAHRSECSAAAPPARARVGEVEGKRFEVSLVGGDAEPPERH